MPEDNKNNDIDISNLDLSADRERMVKSRVINHFVVVPMNQHLSNKKNYQKDFKKVQKELTEKEKNFWNSQKIKRKKTNQTNENAVAQSVNKTKVFVVTIVSIFAGMILFSVIFGSLISSQNTLDNWGTTTTTGGGGSVMVDSAQSALLQTLHTGNIFFGVVIFSFFIVLVVGLFTKINSKNNKVLKKKANNILIVGIIGLLIAMFAFVVFNVSINNKVRLGENDDQSDGVPITKEETAIVMDISPAIGAAPFVINFKVDDKYVQEGRFYKWEFGDRQVGNGPEVQHIYRKIGDFEVLLTVTDNQGIQASYKETVSVNNIKPEIKAFADVAYGEAPLHVNFNAQKSKDPNGFITGYEWTFPDTEETKTGEIVSYTFNKPGIHEVRIKVSDNNNDYSVETIEIEILEQELPSPVIETTPKKLTGELPFTVIFNAYRSQAVSGNIINYIWNFGDGSPIQNGMKVEHTFTDVGNFKVKLTVEDHNGLKNFKEIDVFVNAEDLLPEANIKINGQLIAKSGGNRGIKGEVPFVVDVDGWDSTDYDGNVIGYEWVFGDESLPARVQKTTHTYEQAGEYLLTLNVTDNAGNTSTKTLKIEVEEKEKQAPIINLVTVPSSQSIQVGEEILFDASHSYDPNDGEIISFDWNFGDKVTILSGAQVKHRYSKTGIYEVKVKALNNFWLESIYKIKVAVKDFMVIAKINADKTEGIKPLTVFFDASLSTGGIVEYLWDFWDGVISQKVKTTHLYTEEGVYKVKLKVIDANWLTNEEEMLITVQG